MKIKDSGQRQKFSTGAHRDMQGGKGRYDLLPTQAIQLLARHFEEGAKKYGDNNWQKGIPLSRYLDSSLRHLFQWKAGKQDEDHLVAAAWNLLAAIETREMIKEQKLSRELNDL